MPTAASQYNKFRDRMATAVTYKDYCGGHLSTHNGIYVDSFPDARLAHNELRGAVQDLAIAVAQIVDDTPLNEGLGILLDRLADKYDEAPWDAFTAYELTAAKIREAWLDEDIMGRMITVLTLDELRKEVWQEEFYSFKIKPADRT
ncbi:hypothetical protein LCGC14_1176850 [marine sediment metagenome]|uniref:Uncharacterized protein n=1 Tax=marine sediment metagenome TaxID=412755 RepID=A0A0F9P697_9ZZZZ